MLRVPSVMLEDGGPGFRCMSPERIASNVAMKLKWMLSGVDGRCGLMK